MEPRGDRKWGSQEGTGDGAKRIGGGAKEIGGGGKSMSGWRANRATQKKKKKPGRVVSRGSVEKSRVQPAFSLIIRESNPHFHHYVELPH